MHELARHVLVRLPPIFGVDMSVTNHVVLLWLAAAVTFVVLFLGCRRRGPVASGWFANMVEALVEFVDREVVRESIGAQGARWSTFILTLFFFILFSNLIGLLPAPLHVAPPTGNLNVTGPLAAMVFVVVLGVSIRRQGMLGFLRHFVPEGLPWWLLPMIVPIEVVSWLARPFSLAVRLYANMLAGHGLILTFVGMAVASHWLLKPLPFAGAVIMDAFELFICLVQAFIFVTLTALYIREAIEESH